MLIVVTGGGGFIGSHLIERLLSEGHEVIAVDNFTTGLKTNITSMLNHPRFSFFELGIETAECRHTLVEWPDNIDQIYNLACPTGVPNCRTLAEEMVDACSAGVKNMLQVAHKHGAQFLITSSSEIYGNPEIFPQTEEYTGNVHPTSERSAYEEGKRFAETMTMMFYRKYGVDAKVGRLFNVYGPRMSLSDTRVIPRLVSQALLGAPMTVHNGGEQTRTFCYISDMIEGLLIAMNKGKAGGVYNIGGGEEIAIKALAEKIKSIIGSHSVIEHRQPPLEDHHRRRPHLDKIAQLGWSKRVELEEGLPLTIDDFMRRLTSADEVYEMVSEAPVIKTEYAVVLESAMR